MESLDQKLESLNRLPTGFFPSSTVHASSSNHVKRMIVIAYDHSNFGDAMIAKSIHLGLIQPTDDICILNTVSQTDYRHLFAPMISGNAVGVHEDSLDSHLANAADTMLSEIIQCLKKNGFVNIKSAIMRGDPKDCIMDYCRMTKPTFLITGSRGLGSMKRAVMGSVSTFLVRNCPCPVMVCKLNDSEIEARKSLNDKKQTTFVDVFGKKIPLHLNFKENSNE